MVNCYKPQQLFLCETTKTVSWIERISVRLGFNGCLAVDKVGKGGGLALLWSDDIDLSVSSYSHRRINALTRYGNYSPLWHFTRIYGDPVISNRYSFWDLLRLLSSQ